MERNAPTPRPNKRADRPAIKGLNVRLLRKVQKHILEEPRRLVMGTSVIDKLDPNAVVATDDLGHRLCFPPCGTAACIAGWTNILSRAKKDERHSRERAAKKLGIDPANSWISHPLFYDPNWPQPFRTDYACALTPIQRAKVAASRIDHFIKTGE